MISFPTEKYQLGHTKVFFRAGALAYLEELRDGIVLKLVRWLQGQCYGVIRRKVYNIKNDQRELMKVVQRNFRKFMSMREWGWFIIIQKTRPMIGQVNLEEELRILEDKAKDAYGSYKIQIDTKAQLELENVAMEEEKKSLLKQLEAEQGNLGQYTERQAKASAAKADLEVQLVDAGNRLTAMEANRQQATLDKKALEGDNIVIKKDIEDLELAIQKVEHLSKIKGKLETTLDELNDSLAREKRARADLEKQRRKVEGDLRVTQETVAELERGKKELEGAIGRKEKDFGGLASKLDDEQSLVAKVQKSIKEVQGRVEEMEEELEAERQARAKAERQRSDLSRELESLGERLSEAGGATIAQVELNKKRENEVGKLRKDLEEAKIQHESTLMNLKKKHQDAVSEMAEQIDQLSKMKAKIEKDKSAIMHEVADVRAANDEIGRSKASAEKSNKNLIANLNDVNKKVEEANLTLGDFENNKRKVAAENADLLRQLQELENHASMLGKIRVQLVAQLDEA